MVALARNYLERSEWGKLSFNNHAFCATRLWHDAVLRDAAHLWQQPSDGVDLSS